MVDTMSPAATSVGGGGSGYWGNPGRARRDPRGSLLNRPRGQGGSHGGEALGSGSPILPITAGVGGGSGTCPGARGSCRSRPVQKGAYHAIAILCPCRPLSNPPTSVCLPGRDARQGPSPSGGYP